MLTAQSEIWPLLDMLWEDFDKIFSKMISVTVLALQIENPGIMWVMGVMWG